MLLTLIAFVCLHQCLFYCKSFYNISDKLCSATMIDFKGNCMEIEDYCHEVDSSNNKLKYLTVCAAFDCPAYGFSCDGNCPDVEVKCNGVLDCPVNEYDEYYMICPSMQTDCGIHFSDEPRDVFPWFAGIWMEVSSDPVKICSATIIAPRFVITVADCFWSSTTNQLSREEFTVTAQVVNNIFQQWRKVKKIHLNNYYGSESRNNVAIVEITTPFVFNDDLIPACLFDYKWNEGRVKIRTTFDEEMVSWMPELNKRNGFRRLKLNAGEPFDPIIIQNYRSEISNDDTKYFRIAQKCAHLSDQGSGTLTTVGGRYFLQGILHHPINNSTVMSCLYFILTNVLSQTRFIRSVVVFDEAVETPNITDQFERYEMSVVEKVAPKSLFENCGKFSSSDETRSFPWHGVIWLETSTSPTTMCSHTIIKENLVLSAASCFWNSSTNFLDHTSTYVATAGDRNGRSFKQFRKVSRVIVDDDYKVENRIYTNAALVVLEEPFIFDNEVSSVCLYDPSILSTIPSSIEREGIMISMEYDCSDRVRHIILEYVWNDRCAVDLKSVSENITFCMNIILERRPPLHCLSQMDSGAGLFVIDNGIYFMRGILNPRADEHLTFTNISPYIPRIAELPAWQFQPRYNFLKDVKAKFVIKGVEDLKRRVEPKVNSTVSSLAFLIEFEGCVRKFTQRSCKPIYDCDGFDEYSCFKNRTAQGCSFKFCQNTYACSGTIVCDL